MVKLRDGLKTVCVAYLMTTLSRIACNLRAVYGEIRISIDLERDIRLAPRRITVDHS